jgi:type I restriction enzyme, S subunit
MSSELRALWDSAGGHAPLDWKVVPLESLLRDKKSISVGVMYPGPHTSGGTPLLRVGDIKGGIVSERPSYCVSHETNYEHRRTELVGDELLITLVGEPGVCVVADSSMVGWNPARAIAVVRLEDSGLRTYLKAVLESSTGRHLIDGVLNTTVQKTLNLKDIRRLPIPLPSSPTIKAISSFSEALTSRMGLLRETNATLEAIAQALFKSWFVDFDPVRAKQQGIAPAGMDEATAALFPDSFEESTLGTLPRSWPTGRVDSLMDLAYGKALKATERIPGDVPVYGSGGVTGYHDMPLVDGPSVVVGRKGTVGSLYWEDRSFFPIDTVFYVKPKVPLTYCFHQLRVLGLEGMNTDGAVPGLNRNNVYRLPVVIPPSEVCRVFDEVVLALRSRMFVNTKQAQTLTILRDTLLPRLISGQLRLPEAEQQAEDADIQ